MKTKHFLFVCTYNRLWSRIALALFKKMKTKIVAKSAGLFAGNRVDPVQVQECKKQGIDLHEKWQGITTGLLKWQDMIVLVADDVSAAFFREQEKDGKKLMVGKIKDVLNHDRKAIQRTLDVIERKVVNSAQELA